MSEMAATITSIAALIAAVGGIIAAILSYRAKRSAEVGTAQLVIIDGKIRELGKAVDGRLSALIEAKDAATRAEVRTAKAEGHAAGEQSERDRRAEPQP